MRVTLTGATGRGGRRPGAGRLAQRQPPEGRRERDGVIAEHDLVLATGHVHPEEIIAVERQVTKV